MLFSLKPSSFFSVTYNVKNLLQQRREIICLMLETRIFKYTVYPTEREIQFQLEFQLKTTIQNEKQRWFFFYCSVNSRKSNVSFYDIVRVIRKAKRIHRLQTLPLRTYFLSYPIFRNYFEKKKVVFPALLLFGNR